MEEMLKVLVRDIVDNPDAVSVTTRVEDKTNVLELRVDPADMGKVIGKSGTANISTDLNNHLHFELIHNGKNVNPESFVCMILLLCL